jgi:hypothetical protein
VRAEAIRLLHSLSLPGEQILQQFSQHFYRALTYFSLSFRRKMMPTTSLPFSALCTTKFCVCAGDVLVSPTGKPFVRGHAAESKLFSFSFLALCWLGKLCARLSQ